MNKENKVRKKLENMLWSAKQEGGKIAGLTLASYLLGLTAGAIGKQIGGDWKYVAPLFLPALDCGRMTWCYIPYAAGVATNYVKEISSAWAALD